MCIEDGTRIWQRLPKWKEPASTPLSSETNAISFEETRTYLAQLLCRKAETERQKIERVRPILQV
ncbi:hypothetical protein [Entomobacter blattae]|uniref:hypothetical protein n=1 Tax=Entomobacter blattae TaxID=2762277 RepID=UPI00193BD68D|nr:hypothetical protein [Entomobacter blattae]